MISERWNSSPPSRRTSCCFWSSSCFPLLLIWDQMKNLTPLLYVLDRSGVMLPFPENLHIAWHLHIHYICPACDGMRYYHASFVCICHHLLLPEKEINDYLAPYWKKQQQQGSLKGFLMMAWWYGKNKAAVELRASSVGALPRHGRAWLCRWQPRLSCESEEGRAAGQP